MDNTMVYPKFKFFQFLDFIKDDKLNTFCSFHYLECQYF